MADDTPSRISVSRDALRAELAEMELRLRIYFDAQLHLKADTSDVHHLVARVKTLEELRQARDRGELTPALVRTIDAQIEAQTDARIDRGWTTKERLMAVSSAAVGLAMLSLSIALAVHGGGI